MSLFYKLAFKAVFCFTSLSDKKIHKKNPAIEEVTHSTLRYLKDKKQEHLLNFIYEKDQKEKTPLVFNIHGGGWMYGDKDLNLDFGRFISKNHFSVGMPSYSLAFKGTLKQMLDELFSALSYLIKHEKELNIDSDNIFLTGDSAGAHLALLMAAILNSEKLQEVYQIKPEKLNIRGLILCNPAPYIDKFKFVEKPAWMDKGARKTFEQMMYGKNYKEKAEYKYASFSNFAEEARIFPPILITTSTGDTYLGYQAEELDEDLTNRNIEHEYFCLEDSTVPHVFNILAPQDERSLKINNKIISFINEHIATDKQDSQKEEKEITSETKSN